MPETIVVPRTPADVGFPPKFNSWRDAQVIAALKIAHALQTKDVVFLQAPPGVGKTPLSLLLAKMLTQPRADLTPHSSPHYAHGAIITTITKLLQQQYLADFPDMVQTAMGRDNFECNVDRRNTAANAPCTHGWECPVRWDCSYILQRDGADAADVAVLNTMFFTYEQAYTSKFSGYDLGIFDEAHDLEKALQSFGETYINPRLFEREGLVMPSSLEFHEGSAWDRFWEDHIDGITNDLDYHNDRLKEAVRMAKEEGRVDLSATQGQLLGKVRDLKALTRIFGAFETAKRDPASYILSREDNGARKMRPVWGRAVRYNWPRKAVLMSGTILSPEFLAYSLGLDDKQWAYVEIPSDFPPVNRPLFYLPTVKMNARTSDDDLAHMVRTIDAIIGGRHLGQKGIIHTVSYKLRDEIITRSRYKALMLTHSSQDRLAVLEEFKRKPAGFILVSPSMTTGVDLPEDECRWQIIPKMPFGNRGDAVIAARSDDATPFRWNGRVVKLGDIAYAYATAALLTQAYGRAMRSEEDWGYTYILDSNFWPFQLEQRWGPLFPAFFREAIKWTNEDELGIETQ